jgi:hypothetical protein
MTPVVTACRTSSPVPLLRRGLRRLEALQLDRDGPAHLRGEFPMRINGPMSRLDHNYLSGYALLHLALAAGVAGLPAGTGARLERILEVAQALPARYQSAAGLGNWYSRRGTGFPCPPAYPWPDGRPLCLHDDYDDTAISAILSTLAPVELASRITPATFAAAAHDPARDALGPNTRHRLELARAGAGVYQSWALPAEAQAGKGDLGVVWLPRLNSVELTTVANAYTAVHRLGGDPAEAAQVASAHFVNSLVTVAVQKLLEGDASYLDFASTYYPRFPFAPLAFVVRDHVLTGGALLDPDTTAIIARAVADVDPWSAWRMQGFGTVSYWLNCCAWCLHAGMVEVADLTPALDKVWRQLGDADALWPDIVFFHGAHVGDYSGHAYALALMVETLALLHGTALP